MEIRWPAGFTRLPVGAHVTHVDHVFQLVRGKIRGIFDLRGWHWEVRLWVPNTMHLLWCLVPLYLGFIDLVQAQSTQLLCHPCHR